jgi:hypothetical protein
MKKRMLTILMTTIIFSCLNAEDEGLGLQLKLESRDKTVRLGQTSTLTLRISGDEISDITKGTEGLDVNLVPRSSFANDFRFRPQREGLFTFGPYEISVNGQKLTSNKVEIFVLPQWHGKFGTFFRVNEKSIVLGEEVELVIETWAKDHQSPLIVMDIGDSFSRRSGTSSSHSVSIGDKRIHCYSKTQSSHSLKR